MTDIQIARDEQGATTAEYAACTGGAVGFAALLYKFLMSGAGQDFLSKVFDKVQDLIPFMA